MLKFEFHLELFSRSSSIWYLEAESQLSLCVHCKLIKFQKSKSFLAKNEKFLSHMTFVLFKFQFPQSDHIVMSFWNNMKFHSYCFQEVLFVKVNSIKEHFRKDLHITKALQNKNINNNNSMVNQTFKSWWLLFHLNKSSMEQRRELEITSLCSVWHNIFKWKASKQQ